jgi:suppressor of ftsI
MSLQHVGKGCAQSDASTSVGGSATGADRRSFLKSMAGVAASAWRPGAALLGAGTAVLRSDRAAAQRERLVQPMEIRSQNGVFETTLTAAPHRLQIGETELPGFFYNGTYLPPLWRVRLGDVMRVALHNELTEGFTNLHFHGMSVSPRGRSDNVFIHLPPGHEFHYEVTIRRAGRQEPGLYWYHPHGHGFVTKQMLGGLSGAFVVEGTDTQFPIVAGLPERFLLFKHAEPGGGREIITVNGQLNPLVDIRPGRCSSGGLPISARRCFSRCRCRGCRFMSSPPTGIRWRSRRRSTRFCSAPASGWTQS